MPQQTLEGRVSVVTGGTGALGRQIVDRFLDEGAKCVFVPWVDAEEAEQCRDSYQDPSRVIMRETDVTSEADFRSLMREVADVEDGIDILVNGVGGFAYAPLGDTGIETWERMLETNATSTFVACKSVVPYMTASGGGAIINVSAAPAVSGGASNMTAYSASKAAVMNLTESLAKELSGSKIRVNAVIPSIIDTPANRESMPDADRSKWLAPEEIARVIAFLGSDAAKIVSGSAVRLSLG